MSLSLKEQLYNVQREIEWHSKNIDDLNKLVVRIMKNCEEISANDNIINSVQLLLNRVESQKRILSDFISKNKPEFDVEKELDRSKRLSALTMRTWEEMNAIKSEALDIEAICFADEKQAMRDILNKSSEDIDERRKNVQQMFETADDKAMVKHIFSDFQSELDQIESNEESYIFVRSKLNEINDKKEFNKERFIKLFSTEETDKSIIDKVISEADKQNLTTAKALEYATSIKQHKDTLEDNLNKVISSIEQTGFTVNRNYIQRDENTNSVWFKAIGDGDKYVDFSIKLDGSIVYNVEGYENHDHDIVFDKFKENLAKNNVIGTMQVEKQYREPQNVSQNKSKKTFN